MESDDFENPNRQPLLKIEEQEQEKSLVYYKLQQDFPGFRNV